MPGPEIRCAQPAGTVLYIEDQNINVVLVEGLLAELPEVRLISAGTGAEGVRLAVVAKGPLDRPVSADRAPCRRSHAAR